MLKSNDSKNQYYVKWLLDRLDLIPSLDCIFQDMLLRPFWNATNMSVVLTKSHSGCIISHYVPSVIAPKASLLLDNAGNPIIDNPSWRPCFEHTKHRDMLIVDIAFSHQEWPPELSVPINFHILHRSSATSHPKLTQKPGIKTWQWIVMTFRRWI